MTTPLPADPRGTPLTIERLEYAQSRIGVDDPLAHELIGNVIADLRVAAPRAGAEREAIEKAINEADWIEANVELGLERAVQGAARRVIALLRPLLAVSPQPSEPTTQPTDLALGFYQGESFALVELRKRIAEETQPADGWDGVSAEYANGFAACRDSILALLDAAPEAGGEPDAETKGMGFA